MRSLLQTKEWAEFKASQGWKDDQFLINNLQFSILSRELAFGKWMVYAPEVSIDNLTAEILKELAKQAFSFQKSAIFFRLELFIEDNDSAKKALQTAGYRKAFEEIQPEYRQWVDITADEQTILANMKEKGRYNIGLAERKGVKTRISTSTSDVDIFYRLFESTAKRNNFSIRSIEYFRSLCEMLFSRQLGELVIAEHEGQPLTALITTYYDGLASYLYGASSDIKKDLMAPYAAHFTAIKRAKEKGCHTYDLLQVGVDGKYSGLTLFKSQFGGRPVKLVGGWDYVYQPIWYTLFKWAEQIRRR